MAEETKKNTGLMQSDPIISPGDASERQTSIHEEGVNFKGDPIVSGTPERKAGALAGEATAKALVTTNQVGGTIMGARIGMMAPPPFQPFTVPAGAAIGFTAGSLTEDPIRNLLGVPEINELSPDLRPFAIGGEVIGASLPFAGLPLMAAQTGTRAPVSPALSQIGENINRFMERVATEGTNRFTRFVGRNVRLRPSMVGRFINGIIDSAAEHPAMFVGAEAAGISAASVAEGVVESVAPGETGLRVGVGAIAGFLNPTRLLVGGTKIGIDGVQRVLQSMSSAGRETRAAKILQDAIEVAGEDPVALARILQEADFPGIKLTAAQKSGSPALAAIEAQLRKKSARFGADSERQATEALDTIKNAIILLRGTGDPVALTAAVQLRQRYFRTLLATRLKLAEEEAAFAASRITKDTPAARSQLSKRTRELLDETITDIRKAESDLWDKIPTEIGGNIRTGDNIPEGQEGILARFSQLRSERLPEESLPSVVEDFITRMEKQGGETTSGELIRFRRRALSLARDADRQGKVDDARIFGNLAEATLSDLDRMFQGAFRTPEGGLLIDTYNNARRFSHEFNDTFTRTFVGDAVAKGARGSERIPPELLLRKALGSGEEAGALKLKELEEATRFLPAHDLGGPEAVQNIEVMLDAQNRLLRLAASDAIDPKTGTVNARRLSKFIRENEELLNRFPEVRQDLEAAASSQVGLENVQRATKQSTRAIEQRAAFEKILKFDSPSDAVKKSLSGPTPIKDINALVKEARRGGAEATEGLKVAILDDALRKARVGEDVSLSKLHDLLFEPIRPGQPSVMNVMEKSGLMPRQDVKTAEQLFKRAKDIETALETGAELDELVQGADAVLDLVLRIAGAKAGASLASGTSGATLVAAGRGSSFTRSVFARVTKFRIQDTIIEAARDPKFMAMLLKKPKTQEEGIRLMRQIHSYILQAGLTESTEDEE